MDEREGKLPFGDLKPTHTSPRLDDELRNSCAFPMFDAP